MEFIDLNYVIIVLCDKIVWVWDLERNVILFSEVSEEEVELEIVDLNGCYVICWEKNGICLVNF